MGRGGGGGFLLSIYKRESTTYHNGSIGQHTKLTAKPASTIRLLLHVRLLLLLLLFL